MHSDLQVLHESMAGTASQDRQQSVNDLVTLHSVAVSEDFTQEAFNDAAETLRHTGAKVRLLFVDVIERRLLLAGHGEQPCASGAVLQSCTDDSSLCSWSQVIVLVIYSHAIQKFITAIDRAGIDLSTYTVIVGGAYLEVRRAASSIRNFHHGVQNNMGFPG